MSGSPLDEPILAPLMIGPGPSALRHDRSVEIEAPALRLKPWSAPPDPLDLIMAKLDKLEDTMTQILDFLTTPTLTIEPVRKPMISALRGRQREYLRLWVKEGKTLLDIAHRHGVSSSSVQRSLAAAAKKLGYLTTAELRNAVTSGELQLD